MGATKAVRLAGRAFALAAIASLALAAPALAGTLDQSQTDVDGFALTMANDTQSAQTFTPGLSGALDQVDLFLIIDAACPPEVDLTVEIMDVAGGVPTGPALATGTVSMADVSTGDWFEVPLSSPPTVTAGTQYAIVASAPGAGTCDSFGNPPNEYQWGEARADPYAGGVALISLNNGADWTSLTDVGGTLDATFKTYVETSCESPPGEPIIVGGPYEYAVLGDVPAGYWRLGESSGPTAFDSSGLMRHGTYTGTFDFGVPGAIAGDPDTAVDFSPDTKSRVPTPYNPFQASSTRSFEGWACREENKGFDVLFSGDKRFNSPGLWTDHGDLDRIWFDPRREGGTGPRFWDNVVPPDGEWFHWVLVFNDAANTAELFINSISQGVRSVTEPYHAFPGNFQIGNYAQINEAWNGPLDEIAVYEYALSAEQICVHYTNGIGQPDCGNSN